MFVLRDKSEKRTQNDLFCLMSIVNYLDVPGK